jgi:hypothetical protein
MKTGKLAMIGSVQRPGLLEKPRKRLLRRRKESVMSIGERSMLPKERVKEMTVEVVARRVR